MKLLLLGVERCVAISVRVSTDCSRLCRLVVIFLVTEKTNRLLFRKRPLRKKYSRGESGIALSRRVPASLV